MRGDFRSEAERFSDLDDAALNAAMLAQRTCPHCRRDLQPVALFEDVWGCSSCRETWHLPKEEPTP